MYLVKPPSFIKCLFHLAWSDLGGKWKNLLMLQSPSLTHEVCPECVRGPSSGLHARVPVCLRSVAPPERRMVYLNLMAIPGGPSWERVASQLCRFPKVTQ